jgi:lipopolysaccharide/colanic/teichoic acid biosynthesis glycosyltransferase
MLERYVKPTKSSMLKRGFDILCSLVGIVILFPLFILIGILIKIDSKGPIIFKQIRIGKNFKPFTLYKFRTMIIDSAKNSLLLTVDNDPRITKIGRFLRKTKLDELPQLFNVLKGDMSIVGPRPEVQRYVSMFEKDYREILTIKPGITDYASIEFRNEENILRRYNDVEEGYIKEILPAKIALYKRYLKEKSFLTDLKIIFLTLYRVIKGS